MRNAIEIAANLIATIDNAGCLGEKSADVVQVPHEVVAYFTMRTAILEQWCAGAIPIQILMANFSGDNVWNKYKQGIEKVFYEIEEEMPALNGSSESNFTSLQSAVAITVIGEKRQKKTVESSIYYVVGEALIGEDVLLNPNRVAKLGEIHKALKEGYILELWPTGSKGIQVEIERFTGENRVYPLEGSASAGPSAAVIVKVHPAKVEQFEAIISSTLTKI